ncbi:MAG: nickel-type superoxide dismutase maturation protease [Acidimicrobiia bacterium]|nr:MAG: nickel-type superoxide dismutase maturation protease [Acidimicrobiia bacterium]
MKAHKTPSRARAILEAVLAALSFRLTRYEVAEESMLPVLAPGDWVLAVKRPRSPNVGDVVAIDHPDRPGFTLVKRVAAVDGDRLTVLGDRPEASVDSRLFGVIASDSVQARLILVYRPLPMRPL